MESDSGVQDGLADDGQGLQKHCTTVPEMPMASLLPDGALPEVAAACDFDASSADYYFNSYAHFGIHEEMLKDETRTLTYMRAIVDNQHLFRDKVVLDVGCGTGILSMFAAKAGARKVFAVDYSKIVDQARQIVSDNGLSDIVTVIEGKVEEIELPGEDKVDIILSEWMGYFLLYESMLDSVLDARDKWLKPGGLMFPDQATMYLCGIEDADYRAQKIDFWDNVYGYDMSVIKNIALTEPLVDIVDREQIITNIVPILTINTETVKKEDLKFTVPFRLAAKRADFCHALVSFFDVKFRHCLKPVSFITGPYQRSTHWKQTVFYLDQAVPLEPSNMITGTLACRPNDKNPRDLDIAIHYDFDGAHSKQSSLLRYRLR